MTRTRVVLLKAATWVACLSPLGWLAWRWFFGDQLGANPIEALTLWSGKSAVVILLAALAVTPVRRLTGWNPIQKIRRLVGLFAFFYACLHLLVYVWLDQFFAWGLLWEDVAERPFITVGAAAFLCLLPLALTSTRGWIRRLGRNWVRLHRLVYLAGALAVLHYAWGQKADIRDPLIAAGVLALLLGVRVVWWLRTRHRGTRSVGSRAMSRTSSVSALLALFLLGACAPASPGPSAPTPAAAPEPAPPREGRDFVVYRSDGTPSSLDAVVAAMASADAVLVGEEHDDRVTHQVQLLLLQRAFTEVGGQGRATLPEGHPPVAGGAGRPVVLSLEMFERDVQYIVDEYLDGFITESHFRSSARPWDNYEQDYRPLVEFARVHGLPVVAANAPRRYVNRASRLGRQSLEELPRSARRHLPPLPYPEASEAYREQWDALMGDAARHMQGSPLDGQTLWDAAMGHAVAQALDETPDALVLHMAGGFHVEKDTGIPDALRHYRPWTRMVTVAARPVEDPSAFDAERHGGLGDFVILTSERASAPPGP